MKRLEEHAMPPRIELQELLTKFPLSETHQRQAVSMQRHTCSCTCWRHTSHVADQEELVRQCTSAELVALGLAAPGKPVVPKAEKLDKMPMALKLAAVQVG